MRYALNLARDSRILTACVPIYNGQVIDDDTVDKVFGDSYYGMPIADTLPDGDITDYLYINRQYIYDPKPVVPEPEPAPSLESRVSTVESDVANLTTAIEKGLAL